MNTIKTMEEAQKEWRARQDSNLWPLALEVFPEKRHMLPAVEASSLASRASVRMTRTCPVRKAACVLFHAANSLS